MPSRSLPNLGLKGFYSPGENDWGEEMSQNLLELSILVQAGVEGVLAAEPAQPAPGLVITLDEDHAMHPNAVAVYDSAGWKYYAPKKGWWVYDRVASHYISFNGIVWAPFVGGGGGEGGGIEEAPIDGVSYARQDGGWVEAASGGGGGGGGGNAVEPMRPLADFTAIECTGDRTVLDVTGKAIVLRDANPTATLKWQGIARAMPAAPTRVAVRIEPAMSPGQFESVSFGFSDGVKYDVVVLHTNNLWEKQNWSNSTTRSGNQNMSALPIQNSSYWVGMRIEGGKAYWEYSGNGVDWAVIYVNTLAAGFLGETGYLKACVGMFTYNNGVGGPDFPSVLAIRTWDEAGLTRTYLSGSSGGGGGGGVAGNVVAKVKVEFAADGTMTFVGAENIASVVRTGAGYYTINLTTPAPAGSFLRGDGRFGTAGGTETMSVHAQRQFTPTTSEFRFNTLFGSSAYDPYESAHDYGYFYIEIVDPAADIVGVSGGGGSGGGSGAPWYFDPPVVADFNTTFGANAIDIIDDDDVGLILRTNTAAAFNAPSGWKKNITTPASDWTTTFRFNTTLQNIGSAHLGVCVIDATTGKYLTLGWDSRGYTHMVRYTNGGYDGFELVRTSGGFFPYWMRMRYITATGTMHADVSPDGKMWFEDVFTHVVKGWFGTDPTALGLFIAKENYGPPIGLSFDHFTTDAF